MNTATVTTTAAIQQQSVASGVFKDVGLFLARPKRQIASGKPYEETALGWFVTLQQNYTPRSARIIAPKSERPKPRIHHRHVDRRLLRAIRGSGPPRSMVKAVVRCTPHNYASVARSTGLCNGTRKLLARTKS
jgi:hypothetical protein